MLNVPPRVLTRAPAARFNVPPPVGDASPSARSDVPPPGVYIYARGGASLARWRRVNRGARWSEENEWVLRGQTLLVGATGTAALLGTVSFDCPNENYW
ncbi:hypothetical protein Q31b_35370 [Novipirellula aureliae]|uniref:Uncharacterized protein n=1 Tax=Novipirellula aureliae TaxID=2527966 RepID=A0A5C6DU16_9BACT|nr:hypothetical protein Q31b_35370 [Novipirellula aureliae]